MARFPDTVLQRVAKRNKPVGKAWHSAQQYPPESV
jgi:hypothetical protein